MNRRHWVNLSDVKSMTSRKWVKPCLKLMEHDSKILDKVRFSKVSMKCSKCIKSKIKANKYLYAFILEYKA